MVRDIISLEDILATDIIPESQKNLVQKAQGVYVVNNLNDDALFEESLNYCNKNGLLMVYNSSLEEMKSQVQDYLGFVSADDMIKNYLLARYKQSR